MNMRALLKKGLKLAMFLVLLELAAIVLMLYFLGPYMEAFLGIKLPL
jgi:hypothetical protein